ncbi:glutaminyl-tRNA synthetase [Saprolegnia parasitica CBS 223.65]|uniref:glutamine--tRNA ligase n=1 Tax=Saprolegnia parasitica (strain CBS 223.65) TaxID=695850 RepID=A0A067CIY7_SAPPC|nr:glutaminyl-tRNA synthetase [Saprolegnia parasitica CBS 223.65]KDO30498.1 glutaminyl-tRNA synthetase [Saprolegnia parasitica CBS 223.65]|eukprot:XP_012198716.1 glutaminyl-tRNA synthetase [Saprolegnia parasitica CBS 223.65]
MATTNQLQARMLDVMKNSEAMLKEHEKVNGGCVVTRFPPEPNGYLHVGHAKSMSMNFNQAFETLGVPADKRRTIFRYDDTNPEAESQEYIQAIRANVDWLGWKPWKTTYSSEYFDELYEFAIKLIKKGRAYVCHQSKADIEACRSVLRDLHGRVASEGLVLTPQVLAAAESPFRNRSVDDNLKHFEMMRRGQYAEGAASLRLKMQLESPNPNMWDFVAYRIKFVPHPHIGDKWCIYPTYDYTHCIVDALEHIDYSICTLEFETRRESYYWLLDQLDLYKPMVYEFARLNMTYTVMSKRKLLKLVTKGVVRGWDDPRLSTLNGLKRRGFSAPILNAFCKEIGVTRTQSTIEIDRLYAVARNMLGDASARAMAVLDPIPVEIENPLSTPLVCNVPLYPQDKTRTEAHAVELTPTFFLDRSDVRATDAADFFGVAPLKSVRLKYAAVFTCTSVITDAAGNVTKVTGTVDWSNEKGISPKGTMTWVPSSALECEVRVYSHLFTVPELGAVDDWESLIDSKGSEKVYASARVVSSVASAAHLDSFQFERMGYFVVDQDSTSTRKVFNQIVALKDATAAPAVSRKEEQMRQLAEKQAKMSLKPQDIAIKKLQKDWAKQKKLYESNLKK